LSLKETHVRILFALVALSAPLHAQTVQQSLPAPNGRLNVEFSDLTTIRELADGRVLLFDRKEERLVVGEFSTGSVYDIARKGQGRRNSSLLLLCWRSQVTRQLRLTRPVAGSYLSATVSSAKCFPNIRHCSARCNRSEPTGTLAS
jgi:hypothetical protein